MSDRLERIRRILSDHAPRVRTANEVPPPPRGEPTGSAAAEPGSPASTGAPTARDLLRARLAAIRAQAVGVRPTTALHADPSDPLEAMELPPEDGRGLEERTGAVLRSGPRGGFLLVERRLPLDARLGSARLGDAFARPLPLRPRERRPGGASHVHPRDAVFLDVETTGLSGGTGTVAFLVGAGRAEGDEFVLRQYFLRDFPDEAAVLEALAEDLADAPLVTFNGRAFDGPLLATRYRLHRIPFPERDHLDLLPPSRRIWAGSLDSHALGSLERHVLGMRRADDLPGALMPAAYFAWLREGRSAGVSLAFRHNETDIVSLAALAGVVSGVLADPASRRTSHVDDHVQTARLLADLGEPALARACLESAIARGEDDGSRSADRLLGLLHRRAGDLDAAEHVWRRWIEAEREFDAHPWVEAAKILEHRRRDPVAALDLVERALARCPAHDARRADLEHRARRLRARVARRRTLRVGVR